MVMSIRMIVTLAVVLLAASPDARAQQAILVDPPMFAQLVKAGKLPPVEKRAPSEPLVVQFDGKATTPGQHGGMMTQLMERSSDIKRMSAYGYARLVAIRRSMISRQTS